MNFPLGYVPEYLNTRLPDHRDYNVHEQIFYHLLQVSSKKRMFF